MMFNRRKYSDRKSERGNVFFTLFGAIAIVGILGAGIMATMRGPLSTMVNVNRRTQAEADMNVASKMVLLQATSASDSGDCDADGFVEPLPYDDPLTADHPTGGGFLPSDVGANKTDPWGTPYGYCAWDAGSVSSCTGNRLPGNGVTTGPTASNYTIIALISAGPDQKFQTTCTGGASPDLTKSAGSDDIWSTFSYDTAAAVGGGLWSIKSGYPDTATIDKNIEAQGAGFTGDVTLTPPATNPTDTPRLDLAQALVNIPNDTTAPDSACNDAGDSANFGSIRINSNTDPQSLEICVDDVDGSGPLTTPAWVSVAAGATGVSIWKNDGPGGTAKIYYNGGNVGIGTNNPAQALDLVGSAKITDDILFDAGSTINWGGGTSIAESTGTLRLLSGTGQVNIATTGIDVTGDTTITGSSALAAQKGLLVTDNAANPLLAVQNDGMVGIGTATPDDKLDVSGNLDVSGVYKLHNSTFLTDASVAGNVILGDGTATSVTGGTNTIIGSGAGPTLTTGKNNILIGAHDVTPVDVPAPATDDFLNIGNLIYGDLAGKHVGIGNAAPTHALDVNGAAYATGDIHSGNDISAARDVLATRDIVADNDIHSKHDILADNIIKADIFQIDGLSQDFSDITDCNGTTDKITFEAGVGWHCATDQQGGSGGGAPNLQDVLTQGNDAGDLNADHFNQVGADEFCNADRTVCFNPSDVANGNIDNSISNLTDADADNIIANADWNQTWQWALTADEVGLLIDESTASTGGTGAQYLLGVHTLGASTATPFAIINEGNGRSFVVGDQASDTTPFVIDASGNVGVGIGTPTEKLQVAGGNIRLDASGGIVSTNLNGTNSLTINDGSDMSAFLGTNGSFMVYDGGGNGRIRLTSDGRAGIGDITPDDGSGSGGQLLALDVNGAAGANYFCDSDGLNCFQPGDVAGTGLWERAGTVIRIKAPPGDYATDDLVFGSPQLDDDADADHQSRMFFNKAKSAFRAGSANDSSWDDANVGTRSAAFGGNTVASGANSFAAGYAAQATGGSSTAMGFSLSANGTGSVALGSGLEASGEQSIALGRDATLTGASSSALGLGAATGTFPIVSGTSSYGIFMGDQSGVDISANNIMALLGGRLVIDPDTTSAANTNVSTGVQQLELDVEGDIGAVNYCDEDGNNCFTAAGILTGVTPRLNSIIAANNTNTINNGAYSQVWNWQMTGAGTAFTFGENAASTGGSNNQYILGASTLANSTAIPLVVNNAGNGRSFQVNDVAADTSPFVIDASGNVGIGTDTPGSKLYIQDSATAIATISSENDAYLDLNAGSGVTPGDQYAAVRFLNTGNLRGDIGIDESLAGNPLVLNNYTANDVLLAQGGGSVGIGDATPDDGSGSGGQLLKLDVEGATGSSYYCDADGLNCFTASSIAGSGIWERNGTVIRTRSPADYTTDDFVFGSPQLADDGDPNHDARMFFDKSKGAFRAGAATGTEWDNANVGNFSVALGADNTASGDRSVAMGYANVASQNYSAAFGQNNLSSGQSSFVAGEYNEASGWQATALGSNVTAGGAVSLAAGRKTMANGDYSVALGLGDVPGGTATYPQVSGNSSLGIFMGDQSDADISASNVMALLGGRFLIDPTGSQMNVSTGTQQLELDVEGDIGAVNYCDEDGNNCFTAATAAAGGTSRLSSLYAANADNSINNGAWNQVWNWQLTGAETALAISENAASTGGSNDQYLLSASTLASSTALPLYIQNLGNGRSFQVDDEATDTTPFVIDASGNVGIGLATPNLGKLHVVGDIVSEGFYSNVKAAENSGLFVGLKWDGGNGYDSGKIITGGSNLVLAPDQGITKVWTSGTAGNVVREALALRNEDTNSAAADGIGTALTFSNETETNNTFNEFARIAGVADDANNNSRDGSLRFYTVGPDANSTDAAVEQVRINSGGLSVGDNTLTGSNGFAAGNNNTVDGLHSMAIGDSNQATGGNWAYAIGVGSVANNQHAYAFGTNVWVNGGHSMGLNENVTVDGSHSMAVGLGATSANPLVSGDNSIGFFMGDQDSVDITANNIFAILGGRVVLDPDNTSATHTNVSTGVQQLELDVEGDIGAINYCDENGNNCFTAATAAAGGTSRISSLYAAVADNTINNGAWNQVWNWQLTGAETALSIGENVASTGGSSNQYLLSAATLASSTAIPLYIQNLGNGRSFQVDDAATDTTPFVIDADGMVGIGSATPTQPLEVTKNGKYLGGTLNSVAVFDNAAFDAGVWLGYDSSQAYLGALYSDGGNLALGIYDNGTTALVEKMRLTPEGVNIGTITPTTGATLKVGGTDSIMIPVGTDAERPTGAAGMFRYNTTPTPKDKLEYYDAQSATWIQLADSASSAPGAPDRSIQFNNAGVFGGDADFTFDTDKAINLPGTVSSSGAAATIQRSGGGARINLRDYDIDLLPDGGGVISAGGDIRFNGDAFAIRSYGGDAGPGLVFDTTTDAIYTADDFLGFGIGTSTMTAGVPLKVGGTGAIMVPAGTDAQRPTGAGGMIRYNSDYATNDRLEYYDAESAAWIPLLGGATSSVALSSITAATAANTINNGAYTQVWNWSLTGAGAGFAFSENAASTGGTGYDQGLVAIGNLPGSTSIPLGIVNQGSTLSFVVSDEAAPDSTPFVVDADGNVGVGVIAPTAKLEVFGAEGTRDASFVLGDAGNSTAMNITYNSAATLPDTNNTVEFSNYYNNNSNDGNFQFYTGGYDDTDPNSAILSMESQADAGVGIFETTPDARLEINMTDTKGGNTAPAFMVSSTDAGDGDLFLIDATGRVMIGTTTATTGVPLKVAGTGAIMVPVGTNAQRPGTGAAGMFRYNTDPTTNDRVEYYDAESATWIQLATGNGGANYINDLLDAVADYTTDHNMRLGSDTAMFSGAQYNVFVGENAGATATNASADENVALGYNALAALTSGSANVALGAYAAPVNTSGSHNIAVGNGTLFSNSSSDYNVAIGDGALYFTDTNGANIGIGYNAGASTTTGQNNISIGYNVGAPTATTSQYLNIGGSFYGDMSTGNMTIAGTAALKLPGGTDAQRPTGAGGMIRYNTDYTTNDKLEYYDAESASWVPIVAGTGVGTPASPANSVQFNNSGSFGGSSNFLWDNTAKQLTLVGAGTAGTTLLTQNNAGNSVIIETANNTSWEYPHIEGHRAAGTIASKTIVSSGHDLLGIDAYGYNGSGYSQAAGIDFQVDATPGAADMPGRIVFYTTPDGSTTPAERMRIINNGNIGIGNVAVPSYLLSMNGDAARTVGMENRSTAGNGNNLTIQAGGRGTGSDRDGGDLNLSSGAASGDGGSAINFLTVQWGQGSGGTNRAPAQIASLWKQPGQTHLAFDEATVLEAGNTFELLGQSNNGVMYVANTRAVYFGGGQETYADAFTINGVASQTGDYLNITADGGADGGVLTVDSTGRVLIGTTTATTGVPLKVAGTGAVMIPVGTDAQRPTGAGGMIRVNTTATPNDRLEYYDAESASWVQLLSSGGAGASTIDQLTDAATDYTTLYNMFLGQGVGAGVTTGGGNTALGADALQLGDHNYNTVYGAGAGYNLNGDSNVLVGNNVMSASGGSNGDNNVAIGVDTMRYKDGSGNIAIGYQVMTGDNGNDTAGGNIALGYRTLQNVSTGSDNIAMGGYTAVNTEDGSDNIAIGDGAFRENRSGNQTVAIGVNAMQNANDDNTAPFTTYNTAVGYAALQGSGTPANNTGTGNTAVGHSALAGNTSGEHNTAVGTGVLYSNTTGSDNAALGYSALALNTASNNTAVGSYALASNVTGQQNTGVGNGALQYNTGDYNTALGASAMAVNTSGYNNTALGAFSLDENTTGYNNTAVGDHALTAITATNDSTAVGTGALYVATGGTNTAFGSGAGGNITTGTGNIMIGYNAAAPSATGSNQLNIGNTIYGDLSASQVAIGTSTMTTGAQLKVAGTGSIMIPSGTDAQRPTGAGGMIRYNTTATPNDKIEYYDAESAAWVQLAGGSGGTPASPDTSIQFNNGGAFGGTSNLLWDNVANQFTLAAPVGGGGMDLTTAEVGEISGLLYLENTNGGGNAVGMTLATTGTNRAKFYSYDSGAYLKTVQNIPLLIGTNDINRIAILGTGQVGINTTSPGARLAVHEGSNTDSSILETLRLENEDTNSAGVDGIGSAMTFYNETETNGTYNEFARIAGVADDAANASRDGSLRFYTVGPDANSSAAATEQMRIDSTGRVLIGTTTATTGVPLKVAGTGAIMVPVGTDAQRPTGASGMIRVNTTATPNDKLEYYDAESAAWVQLSSGSSSLYINDLLDAVTDYTTGHNMRLGSNTAMFSGAEYNLFIGESAGTAGTSNAADGNIALGYQALDALTTGSGNTAIAPSALTANTTGYLNTAIGPQALLANTTGYDNIAIGSQALPSNTTESAQIAIGNRAMYAASSGSGYGGSVAIGYESLSSSYTRHDVALGYRAMESQASSERNVALGAYALQGNTTGTANDNVAVGYGALAGSRGNNNIGVGLQAGDNITTGSSNIIIGYDINAVSPTGSNQLNIGNTIYGNLSTDFVGIGAPSPGANLHVYQAAGFTTALVENDGTTGSTGASLTVDRGGSGAYANVDFSTNGSTDFGLGMLAGSSNFQIWDNSSGDVPRFAIDGTSGNVGIGDFGADTIDSTLHIQTGDIRLDGGAGNQAGCFRYNDTTDKLQYSDDCATFVNLSAGGGGTPAGLDTQVQFNDGGSFGADANFVWDKTLKALTVTGPAIDASPLLVQNNGSTGVTIRTAAASDIYQDSYILAQRSRGTLSSPTVVGSGDYLGAFAAYGHDGTNFELGSEIAFAVDGTPGNNDMPGRIEFWTTPDGSNTEVERMRIDNTGDVGIGTTNPGARLTVQYGGNTDSTILEALRIQNEDTNSAGVDGIGSAMTFWNETETNGTWNEFARIAGVADDAANGSRDGSLRFYTVGPDANSSAAATEQMLIDSYGNLGVGTTTPSALPTTFKTVHLRNSSSTSGNGALFVISTGETGQTSTDGLVLGYQNATDAFLWLNENLPMSLGTNGLERMRIAAGGNIGIGDFSADTIDSSLHIQSGDIRLDGGAGNQAGCLRYNDTTDKMQYSNDCSTFSDMGGGGGGGSSTFITLTDAPSSYSGSALKVVRVNSGATGLEFTDQVIESVSGLGAPTGTNLTDLADVTITSPSSSECLVYNGSVWANASCGGGSVSIDGLTDAVFDTASGHNMRLGSNTSMFSGAQYNIFIGDSAGTAGTSGAADKNIAIGYQSLDALTTGYQNLGIGNRALSAVTNGYRNVALGDDAMLVMIGGNDNVAVGANTMDEDTGGSGNTAIGSAALTTNNWGADNTAVGYSALWANVDGSGSTAIGTGALSSLTTGGTQNTALGYNAGDNLTTGDLNIIIGYNVDAPSATGNSQLNIGNTIYGDISATRKIGIGDFSADTIDSTLHIQSGDIRLDGGAGNQAGCLRYNDTTDKMQFSNDCSTFTDMDSGGGGGGGSTTFVALTDTPSSFSGQGSKFVRVNAGESALEFTSEVIEQAAGSAPTGLTLDDLSDVAVSAPTSSQCLVYNGTAWANASCGGGGSAALSGLTAAAATNTIDNTNYAQTWNWSTLNTQTAMLMNANAITSGKVLSLASSSTGFTGQMVDLALSGSNAANTGSVLRTSITGTSSTGTPLMVTNLGAGLTARFNDQTGDADTTPVVIDASGNLGVGTASPTNLLHVSKANPDFRMQNSTFSDLIFSVGSTNASMVANGVGITFETNGSAGNYTNGTQRMAIANGGSVGIGDFSADTIDSTLHIQSGDIRLDGGAGNQAGCLRFNDTTDKMQFSHDCSTYTDMGSGGAATAGGSNTQIQFNDGGTNLGGDADFTWDKTGNVLAVTGTVSATTKISLGATAGAAAPSGLALSQLSDASISSPSNGQVLTYNGSAWVNSAAAGGAISALTAAAATNTIDNTNYAQTWNWSTLNTQTAMLMNANAITSGKVLNIASSATGFTGTMVDLALSGSNAANTGTVLKASITGTSSTGTPLMVTNLGTGYSLRVNDQTGDTDTSPFIIDDSGNVLIGTTTATTGVNLKVSGTGAIMVPSGTDAQRPTGAGGMLRYNTTATPNDKIEYYDAESAGWIQLGAGGGGSSSLNGITAATATNTINNGNYAQVWNWQKTANGWGMNFSESAASTGGTGNAQYIVGINTLASSTAVPLAVENAGNSASFWVGDQASDTTPFLIDAAGNVGIQKSTPAVALDVVGDIQYTGTITDVSDIRLKTDIHPLSERGSMLEKLGQVNTYSFTMKSDETHQVEFGVMAQELEKTFPELVRTAKDEMKTKSVNYVGLIAPMIEAGKELEAENKALKAQLDAMKAQQDEMKQALNDMQDDIKGLKVHTGYGISKAQMSLLMILAALGTLSAVAFTRGRFGKPRQPRD